MIKNKSYIAIPKKMCYIFADTLPAGKQAFFLKKQYNFYK